MWTNLFATRSEMKIKQWHKTIQRKKKLKFAQVFCKTGIPFWDGLIKVIRKGLTAFVKRSMFSVGWYFSHVSSKFSKDPPYMSFKFWKRIYLLHVCTSTGIHKGALSCSKEVNCSPHTDWMISEVSWNLPTRGLLAKNRQSHGKGNQLTK